MTPQDSQTLTADLKPCPFCGQPPHVEPSGDGTGTMISCVTEGCVNPHACYYGEGVSAKLWNTRPSLPSPPVSGEATCPSCKGEGFHLGYIEDGNGQMAAVPENCDMCGGSGNIKALSTITDDIQSHAENWIHAMNIAQTHGSDDDDKSYWDHEKKALREILSLLTNEPVGVMTKTEFELFDACWNLLEKLRGGGNLMNSDTLKEREYKAQAVLLSRLDARNAYALLHEDDLSASITGEKG